MTSHSHFNDRVITILEEYLRQAGLFAVIAEHRRTHVLRWPESFKKDGFWAFVWLSIFWLPEIGVVLMTNGFSEITFAVVTPPATLIGYVVILSVVAATTVFNNSIRAALGQITSNKSQSQGGEELPNAGTERFIKLMLWGLIIGTPAVVSILLWLYINAAPAAGAYLAIYLTLVVLTVLLVNTNDEVLYRLYVTKGFFSMTWQIIREMLRHLPFIASILVVIVLFSIFSAEFWEAIGNLRSSNLVICIVLLIALPLAFAVSSITREAKETIKLPEHVEFLDKVILEPAEKNEFIRQSRDDDRFTTEDWNLVKEELKWRDPSKLCENIQPILSEHATWWLIVLLTSTVVFLFIAFFIYFSLLFYFLIEPALLSKWITGNSSAVVQMIYFKLPAIGWQLELPSTIQPMAKVSLLLSAFIAMMSIVKVLSDGTVKRRFTEDLSAQASSWIALSCIYRNLISPGYQIWNNSIRRKGVACVSIITPNSGHLSGVKAACLDVRTHFQKQRKLVLVTAFEYSNSETAYSYGMQVNCWQMLFEQDQEAGDPIQVSMANKPGTPLETDTGWHGNTARAQRLSHELAERIPEGSQCYVFDGERFMNLVIRRERLQTRREYINLMKTIGTVIATAELRNLTISVYVYHNETQEELAYLLYTQMVPFIAYRDAFDGRMRFLKGRKVFPQ